MPLPSPDPWSSAIFAGAGIASGALAKGTAYSSAPYNSVFDASNWAVNVGSGTQKTDQTSKAGGASPGNATGGLASLLSNPVVLIVVVAAALIYATK